MNDLTLRIASLHIHPVKSCAGLSLVQSLLTATGLQADRQWMVVDGDGRFVSQRQLPRMALIRPRLQDGTLSLCSPGLPDLALPGEGHTQRTVRVWDDEVNAFDEGNMASQWLHQALGRPLRLVRFDTTRRRLSSRRWTGEIEAENAFSDGFPILVASTSGLDELNRRLRERGHPPVGMERFRPNLVLDGLEDPHGEDFIDELRFATPEGPVVLKLVKPCVRCSIPSVDPASGLQGTEPGDTLAGYRADSRMQGGITFGMNAVIVEGVGRTLRAGMAGEASLGF